MATATAQPKTKPIARSRTQTSVARLVFGYAWRWAFGIVMSLVIVIPIVYAFLGGFKTNGEVVGEVSFLPQNWLIENYRQILTDGAFWNQVKNSLIVAALTLFFVVGCASLAAYVLARFNFRGREAVFTFFLVGLLFPIAAAILPLFILIRQLGLMDSPWAVALPQAAFGLPMTIVILRPFFRSIPSELEDAARIDGCGSFGFFWRILIPLSRPALSTVAVLALVTSWNNYYLPLLMFNSTAQFTLPLGTWAFYGDHTSNWALILAYTSLAMVPAIILYVLAERQIVSGLTAGSVKG